ncbi:MAG: thiamine phosphate synthase [Myxococcota bacterium]
MKGLFVLADDDPRWNLDPVEQARLACEGGAAVVQLRAKRALDRQTLAWAEEIRAITRACGCLFFMNDRFDLALVADADGVHLGQDDVPPAGIPPAVRETLLVGRSTHTLAQARAAAAEPVDYVAFGPVFETRSVDSPYEARGLAMLADAVRIAAPRPLVAIGGIGLDNASDIFASGAAGAAVISAVVAAEDPAIAAGLLAAALRGGPTP